MAELTQPQAVYSPRSLQVWRTLWNWLAFFFQIFAKILRAPGHHPLLSSSASASTHHAFDLLPVVELEETVEIGAVRDSGNDVVSDEPIKRITVVLDLDETLVCAYETSSLSLTLRNQATEAGLKCFEMECLSSDKECEGRTKINYVTVFERPGLHEFLKQLSEFSDLILFTAGLEGYARPLVDRLDGGSLFSLQLYRHQLLARNTASM